MNKKEFLGSLQARLSGIPQEDINRSLEYYAELLDDKIEEGMSEELAVAALPPMEDIVSQIVDEVPLTKLVGEKLKPKRKLEGWEMVLLVIGSPLWISLLAVAASLLLTMFVIVWAGIISVAAVIFAFAVAGIAEIISGVVRLFVGQVAVGITLTGAGLMLIGLAILGLGLTKKLPKYLVFVTKTMWIWIKKLFIKESKA